MRYGRRMSEMIGLPTAVGGFLDPALIATWLLGSSLLTALMLFSWPAVGGLYGRETIRIAVAIVLLWPVILTVFAVRRSFGR
jgi:hypothetical protein